MKRRMMLVGLAALVIGWAMVGWVGAQSGTRDRSRTETGRSRATQERRQRAKPPFEERLWTFIDDAKYQNWGPLPGQSDEAYEGHSPHGQKVKLYVNRPAAGRPMELPAGSILVKENFDETGSMLMGITVMYRSKGFAPDSGDWHWTKYEADGTVSTMKGMRVAGRVDMCIECHKSAAGGDYVFANDQ